VSWAACAAAVFAVLFAGVYGLLPAYNRHFAFRAGLHAHADELDGGAPRVACYPQRWDSASFYLPHADVRAYAAGERGRLVDDLRARPDTLLLVKAGRALDDLLHALPPSAEFVAKGRQGAFVVGRVRPHGGPGPAVVAERKP
jgi:hypothetical protein